ncbi:MAG: DEAD/DEAH box helicase [Candidatus Obscuribacterales bacterium]|nr:DEAD/DEAH box helicase [Cyanobacteria bacterium HKST-UBA01]MCB9470948.1 DEAD/DEAH box helicase [Candidatus Obscuribacterales bacterium]
MIKFTELGLSKPTAMALEEMGFTEPTEIQERSIPLIMAARDLMASAQTGSGKTAAFALPIIECLEDHDVNPRALILTPTRELALQIEKQFNLFGKNSDLRTVTVYGGASMDAQAKAIKRGTDIIVATPGRLYDCVKRKIVSLDSIEILVLDEADRLLDMGFMPQIRKIVDKLSKERQTLMFSATIDSRVERLAQAFLRDPETIRANSDRIEPSEIDQRIFHVNEFGKDALLAKLIKEMEMDSLIVFTGTRRKATWVTDRLNDAGIKAMELHGDIKQSHREKTLKGYREGQFSVLVATDVAARGLDIPTITHVINYDLPQDPEAYVHRIGRTGRAGRSGIAISFISEEQRFMLRDIEAVIGRVLDEEAAERRRQIALKMRGRGRRRII